MPRVLGRMIQPPLPLRLSTPQEGDAPARLEHQGKMANGQNDPDYVADSATQRARSVDKTHLGILTAASAIRSGQKQASRGDYHVAVADPQGHVTLHQTGTPWHETHPSVLDGAMKAHDKAVKKGSTYLTFHLPGHSADFRPLVAAALENASRPFHKQDQMPPLVLADHLDELGFPHHAHWLRRHLNEKDETGKNKWSKMTTLDLVEHLVSKPHDWWTDDVRMSLRLAHMTGFRPRRHEYTPKPRATDLRETDWSKIRHYFPEPEMGPKNRKTPIKVLINATLFRLQNQIPLRELESVAPDYPPWGSVHSEEYRIAEAGLWPVILSDIGRSHLIPIAEKMIHGVKKFQEPEPTAKVTTEGLTTAEA